MSEAERLLDVLATVATAREPLSAKQVSELAAIPLSSAYRHLTILKERGFIADLGRDIGYGPGPVCMEISSSASGQVAKYSCSRAVLEPLPVSGIGATQ